MGFLTEWGGAYGKCGMNEGTAEDKPVLPGPETKVEQRYMADHSETHGYDVYHSTSSTVLNGD